MLRRVAIVGYAQSHHQHNMQKTREDMVFEVCKEALHHAGILREDLDTVITASSDFLDGRTISNVFLSMAVGAFMKDESKVEEDGTFALYYALMRILAGTHDVALVEAHTQGSTFNPHQVSFYTLDPLFDRQIGVLNDIAAAALQARMYMNRYSVSEEHLAMAAVKNITNAAQNPCAHRKMPDVSVEEVMNSKVFYDPIRELTMSPISDGACALILASEERAREITDKPVWIEGVGSCQDPYLRDRDISSLDSLKSAASTAYKMAGVKEPFSELDVAEISEKFAHEELMIYEALGLCQEGQGKNLIERGTTRRDGKMPVNPSGGALGADPVCATGLIRVVEAAKQIRGEADGYQVPGVRRALAHGQFGICAQKNMIFILGGNGS
ncbi:MAG TPA: thiolase family protein [Dehalococcoidia bacterium]|nr:thiolase family protein [Dehalococcoidia bacterium]